MVWISQNWYSFIECMNEIYHALKNQGKLKYLESHLALVFRAIKESIKENHLSVAFYYNYKVVEVGAIPI